MRCCDYLSNTGRFFVFANFRWNRKILYTILGGYISQLSQQADGTNLLRGRQAPRGPEPTHTIVFWDGRTSIGQSEQLNFELPRHPTVMYLDLKQRSLCVCFHFSALRIYSQTFHLGGHVFFLSPHCTMNHQDVS